MEIFTLTPTFSLKGEGIVELRDSYQDFQDERINPMKCKAILETP